jgi:hypothetical protein
VVFIESRVFTRRLHQLAGDAADEVLSGIQRDLLAKPESGAMVPGLGGVRKLRAPNPGRGKGKRGGFRCLFLYIAHRDHIHLLYLLDKNEQEDLTAEQRVALRQLSAEVKK